MYKADGTTIRMTRGDTAIFQIGMTRNGETYTPQAGDAVRFSVKRSALNAYRTDFADDEPLIHIDIPTDTMVLRINPADTKALGFGEYTYDIEITFANGDVDTFIHEARFILAPEVE